MELASNLERRVLMKASREVVFRFFTESSLFEKWWGEGSTIDGREGGNVFIKYPNNVTASGKILSIHPPESIIFTYGYDAPEASIPSGGSRVEIKLAGTSEGTLVTLRHFVHSDRIRDMHIPGWQYQLAVFAKCASLEEMRDADQIVSMYFELWNESDAKDRNLSMSGLLSDDFSFRDDYASIKGISDFCDYLDAVRKHFPGVTLHLAGNVLKNHGTALARYEGKKPDGIPLMNGVNVFQFAGTRISSVIGIPGEF